MKRLLTVSSVLCAVLVAGTALAADKAELKTQKDKESYAIGLDMGGSLKKNDISVNTDALVRGIKDGMSGEKPAMTEEEIRDTLSSLQKEVMAKQQEKHNQLAEKNKKEGEAFLEANKKKPGVKELPGGLQYKVLKEGTGKTPTADDTVTVNYKGTLINGTEFDSSYKRGQPITFPVKGVIPGWTEALEHMKEGAKWELFIPPSLAYGERGAGGVIGPNETLIFEVELISVNKPGAGEGHPGAANPHGTMHH